MRKKALFLLFLSLLLLTLLSGCAPGSEEPYVIAPYSDRPSSGNAQVMYDLSDCVVIGHYGDFLYDYNMSRNPSDPSQESTEDYAGGRMYTFHVEQVLKGEIEQESISVSLAYQERYRGEITNVVTDERGNVIKEPTKRDPYEIYAIRDTYMEPDPEERLMLFLCYEPFMDSYFAANEPFTIVIGEDEALQLKSNLLLPQEEREALATQSFQSKKGRTILYQSNSLLYDSLTDEISGRSLSELLEELGIESR